jgi:hypothetical protein
MQYMLLMNSPRDGYTQYMKWPRKVLEANAAFMQSFTKRLADAGELVLSQGLASPEQALRVRTGADGKPVTDGVFPESKEYLAGWWIIDVDSHDRAVAVAAEASTAPGAAITGADGKPVDHFWIELRQVMSGREGIG